MVKIDDLKDSLKEESFMQEGEKVIDEFVKSKLFQVMIAQHVRNISMGVNEESIVASLFTMGFLIGKKFREIELLEEMNAKH